LLIVPAKSGGKSHASDAALYNYWNTLELLDWQAGLLKAKQALYTILSIEYFDGITVPIECINDHT
jgi:hypothetical protein